MKHGTKIDSHHPPVIVKNFSTNIGQIKKKYKDFRINTRPNYSASKGHMKEVSRIDFSCLMAL